MQVWLGLHHKSNGAPVLVNMNLVAFVGLNNSKDQSQGSVIHFHVEKYEDPGYIIVVESYDEIYSRLERATSERAVS